MVGYLATPLVFKTKDMGKGKIIKAVNSNPRRKEKEIPKVDIQSQLRLAEILNDSPHLVSLNGTEWEVRALRFGTQWLIAQKCVEIVKAEGSTMGDVIRQFATNIPAILHVITLALLNDKNKIYKDGDEKKGFSDLYNATYKTLEWDCDVSEFAEILFEVLNLTDTDFFFKALDMLNMFRASVTERKRMRKAERK